ncbi:YraN family protein [Leucobacter chromiireducens]|uniref:UPF0102 protein D3230_01520 n=1 Tax=Leucobacter chromiireducens subsp. solipictus TaxID=398235 RepID=A0ABS1SDI1_9MICO|nr:YraN family protein [Leucobacter chromiireducens]MBL3677986.1 YraN family protein [Leucobacter chromiireducens subsp. solipictus]
MTHTPDHSPPLPAALASPNHVARPLTLAARGEALAAEYLAHQGFAILDRNWHSRYGEIDLLAREGSTVIAVEVKTRSGTGFGDPLTAITARKAARLRRLLFEWLRAQRVRSEHLRIDAVGIVLRPGRAPQIDHLRGIS